LARYFPSPIFELLRTLQPRLEKAQAGQWSFASDKAKERMNQGGTDRADFMSYILKHNDEKGYDCSLMVESLITQSA